MNDIIIIFNQFYYENKFKYFLLLFQLYVTELMIIENDARRYIVKAINIEKNLENIEIKEKFKGRIVVNN